MDTSAGAQCTTRLPLLLVLKENHHGMEMNDAHAGSV